MHHEKLNTFTSLFRNVQHAKALNGKGMNTAYIAQGPKCGIMVHFLWHYDHMNLYPTYMPSLYADRAKWHNPINMIIDSKHIT